MELKFRLRMGKEIVGYERYGGDEDQLYNTGIWEYQKLGEDTWTPEPIFHNSKVIFINHTDIKGGEIYEGDRIKTWYGENKGHLTGNVVYDPAHCIFGIKMGYRLIEFGLRRRFYEIIK